MYVLIRWVVFALIIMFTAWIIPGISVSSFWAAMLVAVIIGLINAFLKPVLQAVTLPINLVTLGVFGLILNALLLMLAGYITPGFTVSGFWSAFFGSIIISLLSLGVNKIDERDE